MVLPVLLVIIVLLPNGNTDNPPAPSGVDRGEEVYMLRKDRSDGLTKIFNTSSQQRAGSTCDKQVSHDIRCYMENTPGGLVVKPCLPGKYFNRLTCRCEDFPQITGNLGTVNCGNDQSIQNHACSSNAYRHLESLISGNHCVSLESDYYASWSLSHGRFPCSCDSPKTFLLKPSSNVTQCLSDFNFNQMYRSVFGNAHSQPGELGRACSAHYKQWSYLNAVANSSPKCLENLIDIMANAFNNLQKAESCHCEPRGSPSVSISPAVSTSASSLPGALPPLHGDHDSCMTHPSYVAMHRLIKQDQCMTDRAAFQQLGDLITTNFPQCVDQIISDLNVVYGNSDVVPRNCSCSPPLHAISYAGSPKCINMPEYEELKSRYLTSHLFSPCLSHHTIWKSLYGLMLRSKSCAQDIIYNIANKGQVSSCSCQTVTPTPAPNAPRDCSVYSGQHELQSLLRSDLCVSFTKIWGPLKTLGTQNRECLVEIIMQLSKSFTGFNNRTCSCVPASSTDLIFKDFAGSLYSACAVYPRQYSVWEDLKWMALSNANSYCLMDLIKHLALSTEGHSDTCFCHIANAATVATTTAGTTTIASTTTAFSTTSISPTTTPPSSTLHPLIRLHDCQKIPTLSALAHNTYLEDKTAQCPSTTHSRSEASVVELCNAPSPATWTKGYNVMQHCQGIPSYTAIATFAGNTFSSSGSAGVLIACNSTALKVATQRCDHPMEVVTFVKGIRGQNTFMADDFYTIQW